MLSRGAQQATAAAAKARSVLRSEAVKATTDVRPLVVVWGGTAAALPAQGYLTDGVEVIPGPELMRWLGRMDGDLISRQPARVTLKRLRAFKATQRVAT